MGEFLVGESSFEGMVSLASNCPREDVVTLLSSVLREGDIWFFVNWEGKPPPEWYCVDIPRERYSALFTKLTGEAFN